MKDNGSVILIADDNSSDRLILSAIVRKEGHRVVLAEDGQQAVDLFKEHRPSIVLMDALMPIKDGFEAALEIKEMAGEELVPIIFLTSLQDAESLVKCLDSGGDDFLSKPYNRIILKAKISAFMRMRDMHASLREHNQQMIIEQKVAKNIFDNVAHIGCLDEANLKYSLSPLAVFNGDTVLARRRPDGGMHIFLGDFTGHGLPAAIGAMPLAEIFYGMTTKGFSLHEIVSEINQKLRTILPVGVFCCGAMVHLDFLEKQAKIWVGGLPDAILYRADTQTIENISSKNLPLGVLDSSSYNPVIQEYSLENDDRFFLWSDGIIEARNVDEDMYGMEKLEQTILEQKDATQLFDTIITSVNEFIGEGIRDDDITLTEVRMTDLGELNSDYHIQQQSVTEGPKDFEFEVSFEPSSLREFNPLPLMLHIISMVDGLKDKSGELYTILAELYSNALEHGILKLDSSLKHSGSGFANYYQERQSRLEKLNTGFVKFTVKNQCHSEKSGSLILFVEDSGEGFDVESLMAKNSSQQKNNETFSGRGVPLINTLCSNLEYLGVGNLVKVKIDWLL
jgi:two-component system, HptB-dependent secretion and biofilm response regulator